MFTDVISRWEGSEIKKEYLEPTITFVSFIAVESIADATNATSDGDTLIDTGEL